VIPDTPGNKENPDTPGKPTYNPDSMLQAKVTSDTVYKKCKPGETLQFEIKMTNTGQVYWP